MVNAQLGKAWATPALGAPWAPIIHFNQTRKASSQNQLILADCGMVIPIF
jgi:hypothetical protein